MLRPSVPVALTFALALGACADVDDFRRSSKGETCGRTDDCRAPLVCIASVCTDPPGPTGGSGGTGAVGGDGTGAPGGGGAGGTTLTGGGGAGGTTPTGGGGTGAGETGGGGTGGSTGLDYEQCAACLDQACAAEKAACDAPCIAIQACIETLCTFLSVIGSEEESACHAYCQQSNLPGKQKHVDVAVCAIQEWSGCSPCSSYPHDYNQCVATVSAGSCAAQYQACNDSNDCEQYRQCVLGCATLQACLACDDTPAAQEGAQLYEEYQLCVAAECIEEAWVP